MPRTDLAVSFSEKDEAKRLGARWDGSRRVWYAPDGVALSAFKRWLPSTPNVRCTSYFIAQSTKLCWKCAKSTRVYCFILPTRHETLESDGANEFLHRQAEVTIVHYVIDLLPSVAERMKAFSSHYFFDFSKTTQNSYWMNHCEHCGIKQGDFEMHCEPGGAFFPVDKQVAFGITLHAFAESFACNGATSYGDNFFEHMRRV